MLPSELMKYVTSNENGLIKSRKFEDFEFTATYKPIDFVIATEARSDDLSTKSYNKIKKELTGLQYVDLSIRPISSQGNALSGNIEKQEEYYERLDYFVTYMQYDISLIQNADTLSPVLFHFERNYGLTPYSTVILAFETGMDKGDKTLMINDQVLGIGRVNFYFKETDILAVPKLIHY